MILKRIIPILTLKENVWVKTNKYKYDNPTYLWDPINTVKIFNDKMCNELAIVDISATRFWKINYKLLDSIAKQAFMPLSYWWGIKNLDDAKKVITIWYEKIILNSIIFENKNIIKELSDDLWSSSVVVSIDIKKKILWWYWIYDYKKNCIRKWIELFSLINEITDLWAWEIIINFVDKDWTLSWYDLNFVKKISEQTSIPLIINWWAKDYNDIKELLTYNVSWAWWWSIFLLWWEHKAVLTTYPTEEEQKEILWIKKFCDDKK